MLLLAACLATSGCKSDRWDSMFHRSSKAEDSEVTLSELSTPDVEQNHIYRVKEGIRSFWWIAAEVYGRGEYWPLIARANPGVRADQLQVGQELFIPPLGETHPAFPPTGDDDSAE